MAPQITAQLLSCVHANTPDPHQVAGLFSWQMVSAQCDHPPKIVLLLSSAQAANGKTRNVTFGHFYIKENNRTVIILNRDATIPLSSN